MTTEVVTKWAVIQAMHRYGGSFAQAIADAFDRADDNNFERLKIAFPELWDEYTDMARILAEQGRGPK
ncbi:MAG TPA: hypothetical protein VN903_17675 [Polyangia bacterium]|nr:hypothetical protein [Polyangia bacterium]